MAAYVKRTTSAATSLASRWLRRGILDQTLRLGAQYYNGKSNQFEFFTRNEQQLGAAFGTTSSTVVS